MSKINFKLRMKLNYYFLTFKYKKIEELIISDPNIISSLTKTEIQTLYYYVKDQCKKSLVHNELLYQLMHHAFSSFDSEQRAEIISVLYKYSRYVPHIEEMTTYFDDFYGVAIRSNNLFILERLAKIIDKKPEAYKSEIIRISTTFLRSKIDTPTVEVANLPSFVSPKLDEKILNSEIHYIISHIKKNQRTKRGRELVSKLLALNPKQEDIKALAKEAKESDLLNELTYIIRSQVTNPALKSKYLYALYELNPNEELISDILALNDIITITNLMNTLTEEQQQNWVMKALNEQNDSLIYTLAYTTKCAGTYQLIEYILNTSSVRKNAFLVSSLNGEFLSNTLSNILNSLGSEYYMKIIDYLYTFNLNNLIETIDFIFATNSMLLFKEENLEILQNIKQSFALNELTLQ